MISETPVLRFTGCACVQNPTVTDCYFFSSLFILLICIAIPTALPIMF